MPRKPKVEEDYRLVIDKDLADLARRLKKRRQDLNWTQQDLAEKMDCEISTIQAWEQRRRVPSVPTLLMLFRVLKLKMTIE